MNKNLEKPWGCIYIYIYIVRSSKVSLCKHSKTMCFS